MKKIENFTNEVIAQLQGMFEKLNDLSWKWSKKSGEEEIILEIEKFKNIYQITISKNKPGLLDGKYPCIKKNILIRLELAEGISKNYVWMDSIDYESPYEEFVLVNQIKYWKIPAPKLKNFYTNSDVLELIKKEIPNSTNPKHPTYQEVLEQLKRNNPEAFK